MFVVVWLSPSRRTHAVWLSPSRRKHAVWLSPSRKIQTMSKWYYVNPGFSQPGVKTLLNSLEQHIFDQIVLTHAAWHSILPLFKDGTNVPHYALHLKVSFPAMPGLAPASIYNILCVKTLVVVNMLSPWLHYVRYLCWKRKVLLRGLFVLNVLWEGFFSWKVFLEDLKSSQTV